MSVARRRMGGLGRAYQCSSLAAHAVTTPLADGCALAGSGGEYIPTLATFKRNYGERGE